MQNDKPWEDRDRLKAWDLVVNKDGSVSSGLLNFPGDSSQIELGLMIFRYAYEPDQREWAFWFLADLWWSEHGLAGEKLLEWNEWGARYIYHFSRERFVSIGGAANTTKSHTTAAWGVMNWMCDPANVAVLLTSTSIKDSKMRVWKSVDRLLTPLIAAGIAPTKLRANGTAPYHKPDKSIFEGAGLFLIAGSKDKERESTSRMIGFKQGPERYKHPITGATLVRSRLIVGADELSELSMAIGHAIMTNLQSQIPQAISLSNPKSKFDAFGEMSEPMGGWEAVNLLEDHEWRTRVGGVYLRMDGEESPNIKAGEVIYDFLPTQEYLDGQKEQHGDNSAAYLRFCRAIFYSAAGAEGVFTMPELRKGKHDEKVHFRQGTTKRIAAFDPSETNDGDNFPLLFGTIGLVGAEGQVPQRILQFDDKPHYLRSDDTVDDIPREFQIARKIVDLCRQEGITSPEAVALDDTMASWAAILETVWGARGLWAVNSNATATDRISIQDPEKTHADIYANRTAEMWFWPKTLVQHGQLRNIPKAAVEQMTGRGIRFGLHGKGGTKLAVEAKKDFRERTGFSPDEADTVFLLVDLAVERYGLHPRAQGPVLAYANRTDDLPMEWFDMAGRSANSWL